MTNCEPENITDKYRAIVKETIGGTNTLPTKIAFAILDNLLGVLVLAHEPSMQKASLVMKECNDNSKGDSALSPC